uniref:C2 NT-type domain-containing protein n=1 Tax=Ananas comosus var. bracteatus TaxID=296719 RepID=A0A6V7NMZ8_ANACO|nr:unnamed protein product [Ananas comosus var. bracteatus]
MVLGLRSKTKKGAAVINVNYIIHILEIKPWPASKSLKSLRPVAIRWENGDRSGSTNALAPSLRSNSEEWKIEFNESFMLQVSFSRDAMAQGFDSGTFQKNVLELNLYETKKDKPKGQLLGGAVVDLAKHGIVKEVVSLSAPISFKKSSKNLQPVLHLKIEPFDRDGSVSMNGENAKEEEIAAFTDDDDDDDDDKSSLSSAAASSSALGRNSVQSSSRELIKELKESNGVGNERMSFTANPESLEIDNSSKMEKLQLAGSTESGYLVGQDEKNQNKINGSVEVDSSYGAEYDFLETYIKEKQLAKESEVKTEEAQKQSIVSGASLELNPVPQQPSLRNARKMSFAYGMSSSNQRFLGIRTFSTLSNHRTKSIKLSQMKTPLESTRSTMDNKPSDQDKEEVKEVDVQEDVHDDEVTPGLEDAQEEKIRDVATINRNSVYRNKVRELEQRVELLEGELREAAATEISLYSIVAEHGSSSHKVHTPARRLSRLYLHVLKHGSKTRRASAARSASSGLVLVAKSCGNDVPRLTFWLSNSVVLRTIITQTTRESDNAGNNDSSAAEKDPGTIPKRKSSALWNSVYRKKAKLLATRWEDPETFISALEKIESWLFSRIAESIWWQTLMIHMQSTCESKKSKVGSIGKKSYVRPPTVGDQKQANYSIEIWKKAFKDACERLCPVRAAGHECGCLPMLARLVMEQCVARLDVAMFNAILRESDDEMPTDPVSDPVSDPKVLPVPSGKSSFGAGIQLKNAIGSWSRWLTDLFGMDVDDSSRNEKEKNNGSHNVDESHKPFHLLNALSDLLMLPKEMLLERSVRKEVCPTFSSSIIKRILDSFVTDEFCPDPISESVLEALESEDHLEGNEEGIRNVPCGASPINYSAPSITSVESIVGELRIPPLKNGSSVVRKSYTSDDELDELDAPLASMIDMPKASTIKSKWKSGLQALRYQLLRQVWKDDE